MQRTDSLEKTLMLGKIEAGGEGDNRGWDGQMASPNWWTWVWASSGSWWWTGRPGVLQSMGSQSQTWLSNWTELSVMARGESRESASISNFCHFIPTSGPLELLFPHLEHPSSRLLHIYCLALVSQVKRHLLRESFPDYPIYFKIALFHCQNCLYFTEFFFTALNIALKIL